MEKKSYDDLLKMMEAMDSEDTYADRLQTQLLFKIVDILSAIHWELQMIKEKDKKYEI